MENKERKLKQLYEKIIISWLFLVALLSWLVFYIYPQVSLIKTKKEEVVSKVWIYENLKQSWITYEEFLSTSNEELKKYLGDDLQKFFEENLSNTSNWDYMSFISEKEEYIDKINKSDLIKNRDKKISKVLPSYTEWVSPEWNMTDLAFVNYIESLLRTFWLKTSSSIWVWDVALVWENEKTKINTNELFYIPLNLELVWRKSDMVEFLYFLQNVWTIDEVTKENLTFYRDDLITRTITWQKRTTNYNIYENKLVDIESIDFPDYIDNSSSMRSASQKTVKWLLEFIKNWPEKDVGYKVNLWLKFYVKGLPTYKIELFTGETVQKYKNLSQKVKTLLNLAQNGKIVLLNKNTKDIIKDIISNLRTIDNYLVEMESKVKVLEDSISQKADLVNMYKEASLIGNDIQNLESYINSLKIDENLK